MGKRRVALCAELVSSHFRFGARTRVALTRERGDQRDYNGVWEARPAPLGPSGEPGFLLPLPSSKITTQQESLCPLEPGGIRKTADLVNQCPDLW